MQVKYLLHPVVKFCNDGYLLVHWVYFKFESKAKLF
jgi:hypothetical protein